MKSTNLQVNFKKLSDTAKIPVKAHFADAGFDVYADSISVKEDFIEYGTGLAFSLPEGYAMLIYPRSSISKKQLILCNGVGVLDPGYNGELKIRFKIIQNEMKLIENSIYDFANRNVYSGTKPVKAYKVGDRVAQLVIVPLPTVDFLEVDELEDSDRGSGGFGSSGQ